MSPCILVVDDEPDLEALVLQKFRRQIQNGTVKFLFAREGVEALEVLSANGGVDLVVTDINMPKMDGLALLQKLQESEQQVSTIIVSAYGDMVNIRTAMNRGAFDFLTKPIDFADLEATIDKTIRHVQALREARERQAEAEQAYSRLRRFLSPQVADLIVSSGAEKQLESHRREISALFCDLRGFTGFSESSDPEDVMTLLREYHAAIGTIIYKYNGTLERFAGDGIMVIFNDPVPLPNPPLTAVQMALEMRDAVEALMGKWRRLGHELGFGIGISHGYATLGTIGFEGRFDYAAIGPVSNVASRLCDAAQPGQILISTRVLLAVEDVVTVEPAGELTLKGISRPVAVHNVTGSKAAPG
ncbi:MAG: response regulator [Xanthobacteraceae bacterium]|nr:response regulator [Xanthobacteraceae bacterium]